MGDLIMCRPASGSTAAIAIASGAAAEAGAAACEAATEALPNMRAISESPAADAAGWLNLSRIFRSPRSKSNSATWCSFRNSISCFRSWISSGFIRSLTFSHAGKMNKKSKLDQGFGCGRQHLPSAAGNSHHVLDPDAELTSQVDARLNGHNHPCEQPVCLFRSDAW